MWKSFFFAFLIFGSISNADVCSGIAKYACSAAPLNLGSGVVRGSDQQAKNSIERQKRKSLEELTEAYAKALSSDTDPIDETTLEIAFEATGLMLFPDCQSRRNPPNDKRITASCTAVLAKSIAKRAYADLYARDSFYQQDVLEVDGRGVLKSEVMLRGISFYYNILDAQRNQVVTQNKEIYKSLDESLEVSFKETKALMSSFIKKSIANRSVREKLLLRIKEINFSGSDCLDSSEDSNISSIFERNAHYNAFSNDVSYCRGMADYGVSKYQLSFVFAHELAHSIDPCHLQFGSPNVSVNYQNSNEDAYKAYPFKILKCLRSDKSILAYDPKFYGLSESEKGVPSFCLGNDQINESFCDWIATEILYRHMKTNLSKNTKQHHINGIASVWRYSCNEHQSLGLSSLGLQGDSPHPSSVDRLNRLTLAHPGIRREIGCDPLGDEVEYCDRNKDYSLELNDFPANSIRDEGDKSVR